MTAAAPALASTAGPGFETNHWHCCDPDTALCGARIEGQREVPGDQVNCVVCIDLDREDQPCGPACDYVDGGQP